MASVFLISKAGGSIQKIKLKSKGKVASFHILLSRYNILVPHHHNLFGNWEKAAYIVKMLNKVILEDKPLSLTRGEH